VEQRLTLNSGDIIPFFTAIAISTARCVPCSGPGRSVSQRGYIGPVARGSAPSLAEIGVVSAEFTARGTWGGGSLPVRFPAMSYTGDLNEKLLVIHLVKNTIGTLAYPITLTMEFLGSPGSRIARQQIYSVPDEDLIAWRDTGKVFQSFPGNGKPVQGL
jgi:hypothetical protein